MDIVIICAHDSNRGIGNRNHLPWSIPADMARFVRETQGHPVIMGRKTHESIGRALPGRLNIVLSSRPQSIGPDAVGAASIEQALAIARDSGAAQAFVIGGEQIYRQALPLANRLLITEIQTAFLCDAFFPEIDPAEWPETSRELIRGSSSPHCYFVERRRAR